uniref:Uncharacterized protein n=1 Tax=Micrurus spixii TaxID=129469 RepID=A0A2D4NBY7_9SAUR
MDFPLPSNSSHTFCNALVASQWIIPKWNLILIFLRLKDWKMPIYHYKVVPSYSFFFLFMSLKSLFIAIYFTKKKSEVFVRCQQRFACPDGAEGFLRKTAAEITGSSVMCLT